MAAHTLPTVLVLLDDAAKLARIEAALGEEFDCLTATDFNAARSALGENYVQVLVTGPICDSDEGRVFLQDMRKSWPETVRLLACPDPAEVSPDHDVFQIIADLATPSEWQISARNAARHFQLARENDRLSLELRFRDKGQAARQSVRRAASRTAPGFETILRAPTSPMNPIVEAARQFASFDVPILLSGEDGTGKAEFARAIHYGSLRSDQSFYAFDCSGLTDDLLALELFGARNGSVPSGHCNKIGLFQKADRGTLYLSGIDSLSCGLQKTLLRVVTEGAFQPVGWHETVSTRLRLLAGTAADLPALVEKGVFRSDLYHALSVATLTLPPLRQRADDIPLLARKLLLDAAAAHGKPVHGFSDAALNFLHGYDWPGNLRELSNEVTRMLIFSQDKVLGPDLISRHILQAEPGDHGGDSTEDAVMRAGVPLKDRVEAIETRILRETLTRLKWNKSRAAAELGLSRVGLRAKLERYGVAQPDTETELEEG
ncbi:MAG: sigma-54-dependent Fis family transcriptional regulator [Rhodobacteraceae bacterium]|nr:sigma-54-dependent Fis family transcriptional regulator [Paracoccaceae bacterium]